ncbi:MAG: NAD(P)/FAD-dependent oxidoreductase [Flavobacterium sp.]|nr:NAD(P)/FAD-dependent oxidoreductase [Pedobacter sp.]
MHIVVIGNGITGITCALNIRKLDPGSEITVVSSESEHFFSRTALMYIYMGHMKYEHTKPYEDWFWKKNRITLIHSHVNFIGAEFKVVNLENGRMLHYSKLVIASGSVPNRFGWPGQDLQGVQGLYSLQNLNEMEINTRGIREAVVVGGGLIGIEMAEMLTSRNIKVHLLVREKNYWSNILPEEEARLINRHICEHHINLLLETELKEIISDEFGKVKSIITSHENSIDCQFVGLAVGVKPNIDLLNNSGIESNRGILVNEYLETNIPQVYAAGDCAEFKYPELNDPPVEQLWYTGKMQAEALAKTICGQKTAYRRGTWFNSAKFLDIEYQTYGRMTASLDENQGTFYWENRGGKKSFRVTFNKQDRSLVGFNLLGLRFRQALAEEWIINKKPVDQCIIELAKGWFDPEFSKLFTKDIQNKFLSDTNLKLAV